MFHVTDIFLYMLKYVYNVWFKFLVWLFSKLCSRQCLDCIFFYRKCISLIRCLIIWIVSLWFSGNTSDWRVLFFWEGYKSLAYFIGDAFKGWDGQSSPIFTPFATIPLDYSISQWSVVRIPPVSSYGEILQFYYVSFPSLDLTEEEWRKRHNSLIGSSPISITASTRVLPCLDIIMRT